MSAEPSQQDSASRPDSVLPASTIHGGLPNSNTASDGSTEVLDTATGKEKADWAAWRTRSLAELQAIKTKFDKFCDRNFEKSDGVVTDLQLAAREDLRTKWSSLLVKTNWVHLPGHISTVSSPPRSEWKTMQRAKIDTAIGKEMRALDDLMREAPPSLLPDDIVCKDFAEDVFREARSKTCLTSDDDDDIQELRTFVDAKHTGRFRSVVLPTLDEEQAEHHRGILRKVSELRSLLDREDYPGHSGLELDDLTPEHRLGDIIILLSDFGEQADLRRSMTTATDESGPGDSGSSANEPSNGSESRAASLDGRLYPFSGSEAVGDHAATSLGQVTNDSPVSASMPASAGCEAVGNYATISVGQAVNDNSDSHQMMAQNVLPIPNVSQPGGHSDSARPRLYVLDYGAGNVRSLANSIKKLGYEFEWIRDVADFSKAEQLIFPGVGSFGQATASLRTSGFLQPLIDYISSGKPYFGICIGMQMLFASSTESPGAEGLGIISHPISRFRSEDKVGGKRKSVPHMGWNDAWRAWKGGEEGHLEDGDDYYFVHSFAAMLPEKAEDSEMATWAHSLSRYGNQTFVSSVRKGNVFGTQFHPEKSGEAGLRVLKRWLEAPTTATESSQASSSSLTLQRVNPSSARRKGTGLTNRIVACLDVRSNDAGDLVVTKGDQYDVREKGDSRGVRNLGKPVDLAQRYYQEGADEICFLNITSFRSSALLDQPMLGVVQGAAETVFVPLTVGGGIKDTIDPDGTPRSALQVAGAYFRSGADKVSIGSEAVLNVEELLERETRGEPSCLGTTGIETISRGYGSQAVVVSIDPKRVYYDTTKPDWIEDVPEAHRSCLVIGEKATTRTAAGEKGKAWWYQCTISGGRAVRDIDVIQLAQGVEKLGAGEILLNSVDRDGTGLGFDLDLIRLVKESVGIPVVASSGAGSAQDFVELFEETQVEAGLAAGIFHRKEVGIDEVKSALEKQGLSVRAAN